MKHALTHSQRWNILRITWRFEGVPLDHIEARRKRYNIAKREGWLPQLLRFWEQAAHIVEAWEGTRHGNIFERTIDNPDTR